MGAVTMTTPTGVQDGVTGYERKVTKTVVLSSTYATNGETGLTPAAVGMQSFSKVTFDPPQTNNFVSFDYTNNLVMCFVSSTGAQVGNGVNVSTVSCRCEILGR